MSRLCVNKLETEAKSHFATMPKSHKVFLVEKRKRKSNSEQERARKKNMEIMCIAINNAITMVDTRSSWGKVQDNFVPCCLLWPTDGLNRVLKRKKQQQHTLTQCNNNNNISFVMLLHIYANSISTMYAKRSSIFRKFFFSYRKRKREKKFSLFKEPSKQYFSNCLKRKTFNHSFAAHH